MAIVDEIIAYESGELSCSGIISLYSKLIQNGMAWTLQGHYGRTAIALIEAKVLDGSGNVLQLGEDFSRELQ